MPYLENGVLDENGGSGGEGGGSGGGSGGGGGGGAGQQCEESELTCNKCAVFSKGYFKGVLPVEQTFALNLLFSDVKHAFVESGAEQGLKILGLRNCKGGVDLKLENGEPVVEFKFKATAKIQDGGEGCSPEEAKKTAVKKEVLKEGEEKITKLFESLFESVKSLDCDVLGLKTMLYKNFTKKYGQYSEELLSKAKPTWEIKLKSNG